MADSNGLPDANLLEQFIRQDLEQDKGQDAATGADPNQQQVDPQQAQAASPQTTAQDAMSEFDMNMLKNPKEMLKSYKEIQSFTTRVSQKNKDLEAELARRREEDELRNLYTQQPQAPVNGQNFAQMFAQDPQMAITAAVDQQVQVRLIAGVLEEEETRAPEDFNERVAYVRMLSQNPKFAPLSYSPKGVKKLFEYADQYRDKDIEKKAHASIKKLFGDDFDIDKFRQTFKRDGSPVQNNAAQQAVNNLALLPDTMTTTRTGQDINAQANELQRVRYDAVQKGDAATVARTLLMEALNK